MEDVQRSTRLRSGSTKRSTSPTPVMEISDAVKQYLEKLIGEQTQLLSSRIAALEAKLNEKDKIIDELNGSLAVVRKGNQQLQKNIDNMIIDINDNA